MNREVGFHPDALAELGEAVDFYEAEAAGLGADLLSEVETAVESIAAMPEAAARELVGIRRKVLRRFPFTIVYQIQPQQLEVLAVMHQRRKPGYWKSRKSRTRKA